MKTVIQYLANAIPARARCEQANNPHATVWDIKASHLLSFAPSGSGFDCGTSLIDGDEKKITFHTSFHHMNECGMYDGWTEHDVIVTPAFDGFNLRVTGRDRNQIKNYIADVFHTWLSEKENGVEVKNADGVWLPLFGDIPAAVAKEIADGNACAPDGWTSPFGATYRWE